MNASFKTYAPPEWLQPLTAQLPCGPSLEYDPDYAMLVSRLKPRGEAQYGNFVDSSGPPEWPEIERQCRELMNRTRDINLLVWLCRARVRTAAAAGLAQGLGMLADVLERWPHDVHPHLAFDDELDPAVRANAIAALCDPEGLLGDVRDLAVSSNAMRLLVRDVERAFTVVRGGETPQAAAVRQQLDALRLRAQNDSDAPIGYLEHAAHSVRRIRQWCTEQLKDDGPDLQSLLRVLQPFEPNPASNESDASSAQNLAAPSSGQLPDEHRAQTESQSLDPAQARGQALRNIRAARRWFEMNEPSSPVAVLLKQAERMVGQRFALVADAIPLDLLRKWDAEPEDTAAM